MNGPTNNDPKFEGAGKLIGGFASGNLSSDEKEALFDAALHDQDLFDALMEEQGLKDLLEEPGVKAELLASLQPKASLLDRVKSFLATPMAWGTMGAVATAALLLVIILPTRRADTAKQTAQVVRQDMRRDEPATPAVPVTQPVPQPPAAAVQPAAPTPSANDAGGSPRSEPRQQQPVAKEQEKRERQQVQSAPSQASQSQERDSQQQAAPRLASPPPVRMPEQQQQPVPAAVVGAVGQLLAIDYTLLRRAPNGAYETAATLRSTDNVRIQVMPSETGFVSLYKRTPDGLLSAIATAQRVTRGQVAQIPPQGSFAASDGSFVLLLSRDSGSADQVTPSAGGAAQGFRQNAEEMRAKRAASPAKAPAAAAPGGAMLDLSLRKAVLPSASLGRAAANSPEDRTVAVEFTIHVEN